MLTIQDIHFSIEDKKILDGVSVHFEPCKIHGIIGPNGSGKSTLLKNVCRIWEPQSGTILIEGKNYRTIPRKELSRLVTLVPQNTAVSFPISVFDIVSMGRNPHLGRFEGVQQKDREIIERALQQTAMYALKDRIINELSGGEGQLAIIARALATEASLILLDEPTAELDIKHTLAIMNILFELRAQGKTILVTMHDLNLAQKILRYDINYSSREEYFIPARRRMRSPRRILNRYLMCRYGNIKNDSATFLDFYA